MCTDCPTCSSLQPLEPNQCHGISYNNEQTELLLVVYVEVIYPLWSTTSNAVVESLKKFISGHRVSKLLIYKMN
jgi:hypothetical protein